MPRRTKLILVAIVLVVGAVLAWQFRKPSEPATAGSELTGPFAATNRAAADAGVTKAAASATSAQSAATAPAARLVGAAALPAMQSDPVGQPNRPFDAKPLGERSLPEMSATFPAANGDRPTPVGAASRPLDRGPAFDDSTPARTHKLIDGDTLPELAKQYLGNPDRWRELYDFNRDVLADPELLPIGAELRIPTAPYRPQPQEPPAAAAQPASPVASAAGPTKPPVHPVSQPLGSPPAASLGGQTAESANGPAAADQLAPVENGAAKSITGADTGKKEPVKLQHLPPVAPVGHVLRVAPRTYVVQPGDTLNSIAEKLYGDGARESVLRQANRSVATNPQDLRPGTVLVVPLDGQ